MFKRRIGNDRTLESFKVFPYLAWSLTAGFAFFVYQIAIDLKETANELSEQTQYLQQQIKAPAAEVKNKTQ